MTACIAKKTPGKGRGVLRKTLSVLTCSIVILFAAAVFYIGKIWVSLADPVLPTVSIPAGNGSITVFSGPLKIEDMNAVPRMPVPLTSVSPYMVKAIMAAEDRRYFQHHGIDTLGILRATIDNVKNWRFAEGASTISQQLAKNLYLDPEEKSARRKLKQMILAWRLEERYSKTDIMESYLNEVYYGSGAYGIEAASRAYFHKSARDLSVAQAAFLAGLVQAPSVLGAPKNRDQAVAREHDIIDNMLEYGYIDEQQSQQALKEKL